MIPAIILSLSSGMISPSSAQARSLPENPLLDTDSYKVSHWKQYPAGTNKIFGYLESRGGPFKETVFFGLQYILREHFSTPITKEMVDEARALFAAHFMSDSIFNYDGWMRVVTVHGGRLPIRIRAVPEGSVVPVGSPLVTVESLDPELPWLGSWFEAQLMRVWYSTNVATISHEAKRTIKHYLELTADTNGKLPFMLHDFGARGVSSQESAGIGGAAHLVNFMGSDTIQGIRVAQHYYNEPKMPAFSIPAAEHSTITSWGQENEVHAFKNMLDQFAKPGSLVAAVSDSYDLWHAIESLWGTVLKDQIIASGATVVIRPDSGEPVDVVMKSLRLLEKQFGATPNDKKYKVINHQVRLIQGDGVNLQSIQEILAAMALEKFSADNIAFGMGGALLQKHDRDTFKFAFKTSSIRVGGEYRDVFKDPVTDPGKRSKRGYLDLIQRADGRYETIQVPNDHIDGYSYAGSQLNIVYDSGALAAPQTLSEIRARADSNL
jgi:nicotinamide phosphoribosyltransferase